MVHALGLLRFQFRESLFNSSIKKILAVLQNPMILKTHKAADNVEPKSFDSKPLAEL